MAIIGLLRRIMGEPNVKPMYVALVRQARNPWFYTSMGLSDSLDGRFECMALHLAVLHAAMSEHVSLHPLRQKLMECFVKEMDENLREIGVSDSGIARKMSKMAEHLYGRLNAYQRGFLAQNIDELRDSIANNMDVKQSTNAIAVATYAQQAFMSLRAGQPDERLDRFCRWPEPQE